MGKREEAAFQKARQAIAAAKASNATSLLLQHSQGYSQGFAALDRLPEEIGDLTGLTLLSVAGTKVRDIAVLGNLTSLKGLNLSRTQVSQIDVLAGLTGLAYLNLSRTQVSQIDVLAGLTGLTDLYLSYTRVSQIDALAGLTGLTDLYLPGTQVRQIGALAGLTGLIYLNLSGTQVLDMRPLRGLAGLANLTGDDPLHGLRFANTPATRRDPTIARIAKITEHGPRAQALFDYLAAGWDPDRLPPVPDETADHTAGAVIPPRSPAPLEIDADDDRITRTGPSALPESNANDRARKGYDALKRHRGDFDQAYSLHNHALLASHLAAFDREMGTEYDPENVIGIGHQALRLQSLATNSALQAQLPDGCAGDLSVMVNAILVYVRRFPDWIAYSEDDLADAPDPLDIVRGGHDEFAAMNDAIATQKGIDAEVQIASDALFAEATAPNASVIEAKALTRSVEEITRAVAEHQAETAARQAKNRRMADMGDEAISDIVKPMGVPLALLRKLETPIRKLNKKSGYLAWAVAWYDTTFGPKDE